MPELPEVETISRALNCGNVGICPIVGKEIAFIKLFWKHALANSSERTLQKIIRGQHIKSVDRRGKFVVIALERDTLLIHLRMSGDLRVEQSINNSGQSLPPQKHDRLMIDFTDGYRLAFNDPRKFGRVWFTHDPNEILGGLGPEPLDPSLTPAKFFQMLIAHHRQLKPLLLDQTFLAGLGNIYTDEALYLARLHPLQLSNQVTEPQSCNLLRAIRTVLKEGIKRNGASIDWVYRGGDFQNHLRVYQRDGQPCPVCGTIIQRIRIGQRSTHYCPACQKLIG
jgi:formamidopyrimidine-DNA glycosylase